MFDKKYIAACIQLDTNDNYEHNLKCAAELIGEAAGRGAKLITMPENWTYQGHDYRDYAEDMPGGRTCTMLSELAKKYNMWIHSGSSSQKNPNPEDPRPLNTSMLINPNGELVAKYTKVHMFDVDIIGGGSFRESESKCPGNEIVVYDTKEVGKLGLAICYDLRFPEQFRLMAMEGADVFFNPASFVLMSGKDHWEVLLRARAIENSCYLMAADQCGVKYDGPTYGRSIIIDPWGNVIAKAPDYPCVITAEIDPNYRMKVKKQVITLENRREDVYNLSKV
ncbi:MAG: carbon-nitrogen hydrolase family protein [Clostridia bacterium]|nr:carbon-nitrogen hydrolase family protein [Clostridia bacterium]MBQ6692229.1 carbon-nitrogen hydrolase family protein [Clostridia bacterium]MBQ7113448.1 carbon-nitrogen hydrolase family protein [Clostridia bacterium]